MSNTKISAEPAAAALTGTELLLGVQSGGNVKITTSQVAALAGGGSTTAIVATAWVETTGSDAAGAVGNITKPYATLNAALDALAGITTSVRINVGIGSFASILDDYTGPTTANPSSKLRSNLSIIGAARPELDSQTAPTTLQNGSVIKGRLNFHSTRTNITLENLGIDSGSVVCAAQYGGADSSALEFYNMGQSATPPATGIKVKNCIALCKSYGAAGHGMLFENLLNPQVSDVWSYFGLHGVIFKTIGLTATGVHSFGHSMDCIYFKDDSYARCYGNTLSNAVVGNVSGADAPVGIFFTTGSTTPLQRCTITNVQCIGVGTYDVKSDTLSTGLNQNITISGIQTDAGNIRTNLTSYDPATFFISPGVGTSLNAVRVYSSVNIPTTNSVAKTIPFDSERYDTAAMHDNVTNNSRLTAPVTGIYNITGGVAFSANVAGYLWVLLNGVDTIVSTNLASGGQYMVATQYRLVAGDYIELIAYQGTGSININVSDKYSPAFAMTLIAAG